MPDLPEYSEDVLAGIYKKEIVSLLKVKTLNDFKLLQLSWIFDLNFMPSFQLLNERDYMQRIISHLPQTDGIQNASLLLKEHIKAKIPSG